MRAVVALDRAMPEHGAKANSLGALQRAGLPVPDGFVLPAALDHVDLHAAVGGALDALGQRSAVAVRSSAMSRGG